MRFRNITVLLFGILFLYITIAQSQEKSHNSKIRIEEDSTKSGEAGAKYKIKTKEFTVNKSEKEWKEILTDEQFRILREKGTERAFTGKYYHNEEEGTYFCAACGNELFGSDEKYDSGSGWPSFYAPKSPNDIDEIHDKSLGMIRTEVVCSRCGSHLGHVFTDGPKPTGLRYCVNSASLVFKKKK